MTENIQGHGYTDRVLSTDEMHAICAEAMDAWQINGQRLLFVIPDHTRTCPLDHMFRHIYAESADRARQLDFLIALGTHPPMTEEQIYERVGITAEEHRTVFSKARFFNHDWKNPAQLIKIGTLQAPDIDEITDGLFSMSIDVTVNRMIEDYDQLIIIGPVFPHEVVGMSGGNKYIFPGIGGQELLDFFHWLGAVITNPRIIGNKWTPVRKVVDRAAAMLPIERRALCMVVEHEELAGLYYGSPEEAWSSAADLSQQLHVRYEDRSYQTVLSCAPRMYDEMWTGGKCMYKLEPVIADGGQLIIYAPHISEISVVHGALIEQIGYHTRDYFLQQWDQFKHYPWGILAHSTHVKGIGSYENGKESPRVEVTLATDISKETCQRINLGWMDWRDIDAQEYTDREAEGVLYVPKAGEMLYRWKEAPHALGGPA